MRISGFTIVRNAVKFRYPVVASIKSILPLCDEFIVNVGDSEDTTMDLIRSIKSPKIKIIQTQWDMDMGPSVLSHQTNVALAACRGDWAFYLQSDEVVHEADLPKLKRCMLAHWKNPGVDALRFKWFHFYGSYWRYRIDAGWYQKQDRIIRNNKEIESFGDAFGFRRKDGRPLRTVPTNCFIYHYGWVNTVEDMSLRCTNAAAIGYSDAKKDINKGYGDLNRFPVYFGSHPAVMNPSVNANRLSQMDRNHIIRQNWWNPLLWLKARYKTFRRVRQSMG